MAILGYSGPQQGYNDKVADRCKPDYESMIKRHRQELAPLEKLQQALKEYFIATGYNPSVGNEASMTPGQFYGLIQIEIASKYSMIEYLMKELEKE